MYMERRASGTVTLGTYLKRQASKMATVLSNLGTQFTEELSCSICLELFTRPKVLPCQHTFCQDCLRDHAGSGGAFQCPNCRQQVRLPRQGVASLPDNHLVTSLCERLQNQATLSGETREQTQSGNRCSFHPSEEVKLYCKQCNMPVCSECCEEGHDGHPITGLKKAARERSSTLQALVNESVSAAPSARSRSRRRKKRKQPKKVAFGREGSGTGQFRDPSGVTVSDEGEIFVADQQNKRIQVFTLQGTFVRQFPTVVSDGEKMEPHDVTMDGEGNLWVVGWLWFVRSDSSWEWSGLDECAVRYNKQGRVLGKLELQRTSWMRGVAVDTRRNHIFITHTTGDIRYVARPFGELVVFRPDGTVVRTVGNQQAMNFPWYITVDGEGNILVSDCENSCVYVYKEDGQFLFQFGGEGSNEGQLDHPRGICTDRAGNIIVADWGNSRVEMFDKTGKFLKHITTDMWRPQAVVTAPQGHLVVTDCKHTVSIFRTY